MKDFNGTVVIVDPEKFAKEDDERINIGTKKISPKLGFRSYFFQETGVGRCFLSAHRVEKKEYDHTGAENYASNMLSRAWSGNIKPKFAQISIDSGTVGVFYLEDIEKYAPNVLRKYKPGSDFLILENFKGKIGTFRDKYGMIHFYSSGTTNFYTL